MFPDRRVAWRWCGRKRPEPLNSGTAFRGLTFRGSLFERDGAKKRLASNRTAGAASSQNAGDQPVAGSRSGRGVSPSSTIPQASQVAAARVSGSSSSEDSERRDMACSRCRMDASLHAGHLVV